MKLRKILAGFLAGAVAMSSMVVTNVTASAVTDFGSADGSWVQTSFFDNNSAEMADVDLSTATSVTVNAIAFDLNYGWNNASFYVDGATWVQTSVGGSNSTVDIVLENTGAFSVDMAFSLKPDTGEYAVGYGTSTGTGAFGVLSIDVFSGSSKLGTWADGTWYDTAESILTPIDFGSADGSWVQTAFFDNNSAEMAGVDLSAATSVTVNGLVYDLNYGWNNASFYVDGATWVQTSVGGSNSTVDIVLENTGAFSVDMAFSLKPDTGEYAVGYGTSTGTGAFAVYSIEVFNGTELIGTWSNGVWVGVETAPALYEITYDFSGCIGNFVGADGSELSISEIEAGTEVTIVLSDFSTGYELDTITATGESGTAVTLTENADGTFTFTMPAENVDISATVKEVLPTAITLKADKTNILVGGKASITATFTPAEIANEEITWTSSDESVATVMYGQVTGVAEGTAVITATSVADPTVSADITITVTTAEIPATSVTITTPEITLLDSVTAEIEYEYAPADTTDELVWTSSDEDVAIVSQTGVITPISAGTAIITLTVGEFSDTCTVTVISEGYDKTEASFTADTIVAQTSKSINSDGDVVTARRFVKMVSKASIEDKNLVTFTLSNGTATKTVEATSYYTELSASGENVVAPEGYVFLAYTVTDIPEGVTVTCTDIAVSKK